MATRITETELILPSLYLMKLNGGAIKTSDLIKKLREIMRPEGEDLEILARRSDDKFSQKVRNLRAHKTFERFGYAKYEIATRDGFVEITRNGERHLSENQEILNYLLINDFAYGDITENLREIETNVIQNKPRRKIQTFDENIIIQEGLKRITEVSRYVRSQTLRDFAIAYFTVENRISCKCCSFNFSDFYGEDIGRGFIEIHHTKPIFQYEDQDIENTLQQAINNLIPVCSNCHRMIHRNWSKPIELQVLIEGINNNGVFKNIN